MIEVLREAVEEQEWISENFVCDNDCDNCNDCGDCGVHGSPNCGDETCYQD